MPFTDLIPSTRTKARFCALSILLLNLVSYYIWSRGGVIDIKFLLLSNICNACYLAFGYQWSPATSISTV
ncbi:hypothetical protein BDW59DRAFT_142402 [Aspergillus cavernicola]|uniref:Uncharacterized protein n=1 Tax=Aspergillus cavernicola TaxID=176166 RepID=A0ABR4INS3_9EURO